MEKKKTYIAIDLKSFYASVECVARGLDPLTTNLLVADVSKTEKTICLAVTPSLKAYGISGRARLFEAVQQVKMVNAQRKAKLRGKDFEGSSYNDTELKKTRTSLLTILQLLQGWLFIVSVVQRSLRSTSNTYRSTICTPTALTKCLSMPRRISITIR